MTVLDLYCITLRWMAKSLETIADGLSDPTSTIRVKDTIKALEFVSKETASLARAFIWATTQQRLEDDRKNIK